MAAKVITEHDTILVHEPLKSYLPGAQIRSEVLVILMGMEA